MANFGKGPIFLHPAERQLLEATVAFANMNVRSAAQVEKLFMAVPLTARPFKVIPRKDWRAYLEDQATLRLWLAKLADLGEAARPLVGPEVARRLNRTVTVRLTYDADRHEMKAVSFLDGVEACWSYAVGLLLDRTRGLTTRVGRCGWDRCGRFQLSLGGRGRPRMYCSDAHRRQAEFARRKEKRRRKRGEKT
ncbi:MAG: hypothetical protein QN197_13235 [Armatimonadota bacterium]|nr:hypothetical protein [Armatimonadota bacterium]MDR7574357.1 hypothetical protein [Armatimonadota bacterium]